jgi:uncharacterized protein (DUF3084 family)
MTEMSLGTAESDLSKLLLLASDPEASKRIGEQLSELSEKRSELIDLRAELAAKERELDEWQKRLDAVEARNKDLAIWFERKEQADKELTQHLNQRQAEITARETTAFAERDEKLQAGETKLAQLKKQIDNLMAQFRADLAAL